MDDRGLVPATVIAQLSDLHLGPPGVRVHGVDPAAQVRRVARSIVMSELAPDAVLLTGDLPDDGGLASYEVLMELSASSFDRYSPQRWEAPLERNHRTHSRLSDAPTFVVDAPCPQRPGRPAAAGDFGP